MDACTPETVPRRSALVDRRRPRASVRSARARGVRSLPPIVVVLVVYAVSRLVTSTWMALGLRVAPTPPGVHRAGHTPTSFADLSSVWDGWYYRVIAAHGYPSDLPVDGSGAVQGNPWAFMPVYPWLVHVVDVTTGLGHGPAAVLVAVLAGGAAACLLLRVLEPRIGTTRALWSVTLFCCGPMSFVLQVGYAESLFLALLLAALLAMQHRRYWLLLPLGCVAAFTRPGALALALALAVHGVARLVRRAPVPFRDRVAIVVSGIAIAAAGLAWPVVAGVVTGVPDAYLRTELAWWRQVLGPVDHLVPLTPWLLLATSRAGVVGGVVVAAGIAVAAWWLLRRRNRVLGVDVLATTGSYLLYLVAVFLPQQSLPRLLLPLAPLLGSPTIVGTRRRRVTALVLCLLLQPLAVWALWIRSYP